MSHLNPLIGLVLYSVRRAADMRGFDFRPIQDTERCSRSDYSLHVQCSWRLEGPNGIITGRSDLWEPIDITKDSVQDAWDYDKDGNLQDKILDDFLGPYDPLTKSYVKLANQLVVENVQTDDYGGAIIKLSGGYRLVVFPAGSQGEDWRMFRPGLHEPHFIISGGSVERD